MDWQPIDSAPTDGSEVLFFSPLYGICTGYADMFNGKTCWRADFDDQYLDMTPTHWMPLPAAPAE